MKFEKHELNLLQDIVNSDKTEEEVSKFRHALIQSLNIYAEKSIKGFAGDPQSDFVHNQLSNVKIQKAQEHRIAGIPEQHYENAKRHREEFKKEQQKKIEDIPDYDTTQLFKKKSKKKKVSVKTKIFDLIEKRFRDAYFTHKDLLVTLLIARGVIEKPEDYNWRTHRGIYSGAISAYNSDYFYSPGRDGRWLEKSVSTGYCLKGRRYDN